MPQKNNNNLNLISLLQSETTKCKVTASRLKSKLFFLIKTKKRPKFKQNVKLLIKIILAFHLQESTKHQQQQQPTKRRRFLYEENFVVKLKNTFHCG